jgi:hypothetical protein
MVKAQALTAKPGLFPDWEYYHYYKKSIKSILLFDAGLGWLKPKLSLPSLDYFQTENTITFTKEYKKYNFIWCRTGMVEA